MSRARACPCAHAYPPVTGYCSCRRGSRRNCELSPRCTLRAPRECMSARCSTHILGKLFRLGPQPCAVHTWDRVFERCRGTYLLLWSLGLERGYAPLCPCCKSRGSRNAIWHDVEGDYLGRAVGWSKPYDSARSRGNLSCASPRLPDYNRRTSDAVHFPLGFIRTSR